MPSCPVSPHERETVSLNPISPATHQASLGLWRSRHKPRSPQRPNRTLPRSTPSRRRPIKLHWVCGDRATNPDHHNAQIAHYLDRTTQIAPPPRSQHTGHLTISGDNPSPNDVLSTTHPRRQSLTNPNTGFSCA
jgi:hypothetical protein